MYSCLPDASFLITFYSPFHPSDSGTRPSEFNVLIDPWLAGNSVIYHPIFAFAKHSVPACITHLSELPTPDVVIVSQDQTDHCHEPTLRQLDPRLPDTVILAAPPAAKKIRGWKYFDPAKVHAFEPYSEKRPKAVMRFYVPAGPHDAGPGEATVCFIPEKRDMTGLHNAIGITYRPPTPGVPPVPALPINTSTWQLTTTPSKSPTASASPYPRDLSASSAYPPSPPATPSLRGRSSSDLASSTYRSDGPPSAVSCDTPATARSLYFGRTASPDSCAAPPPLLPPPKLRTLTPRSATKSTPNLRDPQPWSPSHHHQYPPAAGATNGAGAHSRTHSRASSQQSQNFSRPFSTHRRHASSVGSQTGGAPSATSQTHPQRARPPSRRSFFETRPYTADPATYDPYRPSAAALAAAGALDPRPVPASARTTYTRPRACSLLYSPHGLAASAVRAYAAFHLVPAAALPLTALLHPFNQTRNPWYLGGVVIAGLPGGLEVARLLGAKCWVSAHDGEKEQGGWAVRTARTRRWGREGVRRVLEGSGAGGGKGAGWERKGASVDVRSLGVGEELLLQAG